MTQIFGDKNPRIDRLEKVVGMLVEISEMLIHQNINQMGGPHGINQWLVLLNEARDTMRGVTAAKPT